MSNKKIKAQKIFLIALLSKEDWEKEKKLLDYRFTLAQKQNTNRPEIKMRSGLLLIENQCIDTALSV